MAPQGTPASRRMDWIDYGRFIAAVWVMLDHYCFVGVSPKVSPITGYGLLTNIAAYGHLALYFFLITSGLVITLTSQKLAASQFVVRRAVRIYPAFLLCMTVTAMLGPLGPPRMHVSLWQYLANLSVAPAALGFRPVDPVYWTLAIEITFYTAILVLIVTGMMKRIQWVVAIWVLLQALFSVIPVDVPLLSRPYDFIAAGAVLAMIYQGRNRLLNFALLGVSLVLCMRSCAFIAATVGMPLAPYLVLIAAYFALFLGLRNVNVRLPFAQRLGSLTYPLYLLHFHIGLIVIHLFGDDANKWPLLVGLIAGMIAISAAVDDVMEFRLRPLWTRVANATIAAPFRRWEAVSAARRAAAQEV
jgi:peptidoglycan/LPS O-acetylase OafA/YrhL